MTTFRIGIDQGLTQGYFETSEMMKIKKENSLTEMNNRQTSDLDIKLRKTFLLLYVVTSAQTFYMHFGNFLASHDPKDMKEPS